MPNYEEIFRKANENEKKIVKDSLYHISNKIWKYILEEKYEIYIKISESKQNKNTLELFLIPQQLEPEINKIKKLVAIKFSGIPLGFIKNKRLFLSLEAAELFFNLHKIDPRNILILNEKGEKSVLYGNPIKKAMILNISSEIRTNKMVFLINKNQEFLGLGLLKINYENFRKLNNKDNVALNLVDKGSYLRRDQ